MVTSSGPVEANEGRARVRATGKAREGDDGYTHTFSPLYEDYYYYHMVFCNL